MTPSSKETQQKISQLHVQIQSLYIYGESSVFSAMIILCININEISMYKSNKKYSGCSKIMNFVYLDGHLYIFLFSDGPFITRVGVPASIQNLDTAKPLLRIPCVLMSSSLSALLRTDNHRSNFQRNLRQTLLKPIHRETRRVHYVIKLANNRPIECLLAAFKSHVKPT